jgi:hypothetical protein
MTDNTTKPAEAAIPDEGLLFHATVRTVREKYRFGAKELPAYAATLDALGFTAEITLDAPLPFHSEFDVIVKPVKP